MKPTYSPARVRAGFLIVVIALGLLTDVVATTRRFELAKILDGTRNDLYVMILFGPAFRQINTIEASLGILFALTFLAWIYRVHKNLLALGSTRLRCSSSMAVAVFLIPVINLYRPYHVCRDVWTESGGKRDSRLVMCWWILTLLWIEISITGYALLNLLNGEQLVRMTRSLMSLGVISGFVEIANMSLLLIFVCAVQKLQARRFDEQTPARARSVESRRCLSCNATSSPPLAQCSDCGATGFVLESSAV